MMEIMELKLQGLRLIRPFFVEDNRGYFCKTFVCGLFSQYGLRGDIGECFETFSTQCVVRGLHFQTTLPQVKLVRAVSGEIFDVAVDLRKGSPTYGQYEAVHLSDENRHMLYIPQGFAHGFSVISDEALVSYQCFGAYDADSDTGIVWNDETIGIPWPISKTPIVSGRDANLQTFLDFDKYNPFTYDQLKDKEGDTA